MENNQFLLKVFNDPNLLAKDKALIIDKFKKVTFAKNDFLLTEGKIANYYWYIESGFVRSYATDPEGNDISTNFFATGDLVIDWSSFFMRNPTRENMQALTDCVCWQLDFQTFQQLFHSIEAFRESGRTRLVSSYFELKKNRISMIVDPAKDRYKMLMKEKPEIIQNVSLKQIATYLGITDTSLSRIRKEISME
ncbi:MAG: Crp/Fnr family transcriptional regulator [Bacteroidetes bacterium]|nr:MAG: Crp/Fnr family transcriptional regulator [Bacteroidota bacterium]